jgi:hypothetical protein
MDGSPAARPFNLAAKVRKRFSQAKEIAANVKDDAVLYQRTVEQLKSLFMRTQDARWATLRCDLFLYSIDKSKAISKPADPLYSILYDVEQFVAGKGSAVQLLAKIRKALETARPSVNTGQAAVPTTHLTKMRPKIKEAVESTITLAQSHGPTGEVFLKSVKEFGYAREFVQRYLSVVKHPMDYGTMKKNCVQYKSWDEALHDAELVYLNCKAFNGESEYTAEAERLFQHFRNLIALARFELESAASSTGSSEFSQSMCDVTDIVMICNEPHLLRRVSQVLIADALPLSCVHGSRIYEVLESSAPNVMPDHVLSCLFILLVADMARARLKSLSDAAIAAAVTANRGRGRGRGRGRVVAAIAHTRPDIMTTEQLLNLLGPLPPSGSACPVLASSLPVYIDTLCRSLQNAFMSIQLEEDATTESPPIVPSYMELFASFDSFFERGVSLCQSVPWKPMHDVLRRGQHPFPQAVSVLVTAFLAHHLPSDNFVRSWNTVLAAGSIVCSEDGDFDNFFPYTVVPVLLRQLKVVGADASTFARKVVTDLFAPLLEVSNRTPSVKSATHELFVRSLKAMLPTIDADFIGRAVEFSLSCLPPYSETDPTEEAVDLTLYTSTIKRLEPSKLAAYVPELLRSGLLSPTAVVLTNPDFFVARMHYTQLLCARLPDDTLVLNHCNLASVGLSTDFVVTTARHPSGVMLLGVSASPTTPTPGTPFPMSPAEFVMPLRTSVLRHSLLRDGMTPQSPFE